MKIKDFKENEIRATILNKANLGKINKKTPHWKGYIYCGDILVAKVKIPNDHQRIMHESKSKYIARDLRLSNDEFNAFNECTFTSKNFSDRMRTLV